MRILFIIPYVPNLIRVRPYNLLRYLAERGNEITLATVWNSSVEEATLDQIRPYCRQVEAFNLPTWRSLANCIPALATSDPLQSVYCWQPGLARQLEQIIQPQPGKFSYDVVHIEHLRGARYGLAIKAHFPGMRVVWDSVDCISLLFKQATNTSKSLPSRLLTRFELGRTERYENHLLGRFDHTLVTSEADKKALLSLSGQPGIERPITVLPNGVDLTYFTPGEESHRDEASLVISGKMSYHANITMVLYFTQSILPLVWAKYPQAKLWIVGKDPPDEIRRLAQNPNIQVTGAVPDLRPYLQTASLAVTPILYGAGIQNKVLEAMACATPVVSTPQAISALNVIPGKDVLVAGQADDFAAQVIKLLADQQLRRQVGQAGRQYVENFHRWDIISERLEQIYRE